MTIWCVFSVWTREQVVITWTCLTKYSYVWNINRPRNSADTIKRWIWGKFLPRTKSTSGTRRHSSNAYTWYVEHLLDSFINVLLTEHVFSHSRAARSSKKNARSGANANHTVKWTVKIAYFPLSQISSNSEICVLSARSKKRITRLFHVPSANGVFETLQIKS